MTKQTRYEKILRHLKSGKSITSFQAFNLYSITRLSDIIYWLRKHGHDIADIMLTLKSGKRCKQYYLEMP